MKLAKFAYDAATFGDRAVSVSIHANDESELNHSSHRVVACMAEAFVPNFPRRSQIGAKGPIRTRVGDVKRSACGFDWFEIEEIERVRHFASEKDHFILVFESHLYTQE